MVKRVAVQKVARKQTDAERDDRPILTPAERRAALHRAGWNGAMVAEHTGVTPGLVSRILNDRGRSAQVEAHIARVTGLPLASLFPPSRPRRKAA